MKHTILWLLLVSFGMRAMDAPLKPISKQPIPWRVYTADLRKIITEGARKTIILNDKQAKRVAENITVAIQKQKSNAPNKLITLFVHKGDEPYAGLMAAQDTKTFRAFSKMVADLAEIRFSLAGPEKGRPLAALQPQAPDSELEFISYSYGSKNKDEVDDEKEVVKLLDLFLHSLERLNQNKNLKIVIIAAEESAHVVNLMTREPTRKPIDTLIYFQSPIYQWTPAVTTYTYHEDMAPQNFVHLYHLYTKGAPQISGWSGKSIIYLERKYRQQARIENGQVISPVKNIRSVKVNSAGQLENFSVEDFFSEYAIRNYVTLFEQSDSYQVNSDLIAKVFGQTETPGAVAINRFVRLNGNVLEQSLGASLVGYEYHYPIITLEGISLKEIRRAFSLEVEESMGQLINITSIPTEQGWYVISKLLGDVGTDINRIKLMHAKVLSSPLYEFRIDANANQFAYIISNKVKDEIKTIANQTGLTQDFIEGQIKSGAYYMSLLLRGQAATIPTRNQEEYLRSIISIIWFLYSQAIENNQLFDEGTFVLEDLGWRVNTFLMNYIQTFGGTVSGAVFKDPRKLNSPIVTFKQPLTQTIQDPPLHWSNNPYGYPRESSHYHVSQRTFRHYGIDIRFGNSSELPLLPASKRHILFGKIDNDRQLLFIKPENYGLYYKDGMLYHGVELVESKLRKFGVTPKSDDDPSYAKERIPAAFLNDFAIEVAASGLPNDRQKELINLAMQDNWGIKILYFDALLANERFQALEKKYAQLYKHLRLRSGREVILTNQDLQNILRINQQQQLVTYRVQQPITCERVRTA